MSDNHGRVAQHVSTRVWSRADGSQPALGSLAVWRRRQTHAKDHGRDGRMAEPTRAVGMREDEQGCERHTRMRHVRESHRYGGLKTRAGWWMERERAARDSGTEEIGNRDTAGGMTASSAGTRGERERTGATRAHAASLRRDRTLTMVKLLLLVIICPAQYTRTARYLSRPRSKIHDIIGSYADCAPRGAHAGSDVPTHAWETNGRPQRVDAQVSGSWQALRSRFHGNSRRVS